MQLYDNNQFHQAVCGTDGKTYKSECQLKRRACRQETTSLSVAYKGHCQSKFSGSLFRFFILLPNNFSRLGRCCRSRENKIPFLSAFICASIKKPIDIMHELWFKLKTNENGTPTTDG